MKKTTFLFVFSAYLLVLLLKLQERELIDIIITFFQVFFVFGVAGSVKSMQRGYSLDEELNSASNELSRLEFE